MDYTSLLPFMDKDELKDVAFKVINGELPNVKLERLFPFLGKESLHEIVDLLIEKKDVKTMTRALPFIGRDKVGEIYQKALDGELPDTIASRCLPFLGSEKIKEVFRELVKRVPAEADKDDDDEDDDI